MTHTEIIYRRRLAVLAHAQSTGNVARACRTFGISPDPLLRVEEPGRSLRPRCPYAQGAPRTPDALGHAHPRRRASLDPGRARADHRLPPIRRPARRPGLCDRQVHGAKAPGRPWAGHAGQAPGPGRRHRSGHDGPAHRGGPDDEPFGFCLASGGPGRAGLHRQLLHRQAQGRGQGVPAQRHRRLHPPRLRRSRRRHPRRHRVDALPRAPAAPLPAPRLKVRAVLSDNGPEYNASAFSAAVVAKGSPMCASQPARPTTTPWSSASTAPSSKSAGAPPSTAATSPRSASSRPKLMPSSSPTTGAGATTATTCAVGPLKRSSTTTSRTRQHDNHQPQRPSVTSTLGPEALGDPGKRQYLAVDEART